MSGELQSHSQGWFQELLLDKKPSTLQKLEDPPEQCKVTTAMTSPKTRQWAGRDHVCTVRQLGKLVPSLFFWGNESVTRVTLHTVFLLWNYYHNKWRLTANGSNPKYRIKYEKGEQHCWLHQSLKNYASQCVLGCNHAPEHMGRAYGSLCRTCCCCCRVKEVSEDNLQISFWKAIFRQ